MDTELSVQKQDCTRYDEKFAAVVFRQKASMELLTLIIHWSPQKLAKTCRGTMTYPHHIDSNRTESPIERSEE